jgi:anti-sigma factor RsiW
MNCADFEILLCDYLDGTLAEERRHEIERHMETCASCAALAVDVRSALGLMERAAVWSRPRNC